jgi:hypothetical protein
LGWRRFRGRWGGGGLLGNQLFKLHFGIAGLGHPGGSPASLEISAMQDSRTRRPSTVAITSRLFFMLVIRTWVPKDMLEWDIVNPLFDGLYKASPVWVWAKQKTEKKRPNVSAALKRFINYFLLLKN